MATVANYEKIKKEYDQTDKSISLDEFIEQYCIEEYGELGIDIYLFGEFCLHRVPAIDHFPELKEYEIWMEGGLAIGENDSPVLIGKSKGRNFSQACHKFMCERKLEQIAVENDTENTKKSRMTYRWDYNPDTLSLSGSGLHWSKARAEKWTRERIDCLKLDRQKTRV